MRFVLKTLAALVLLAVVVAGGGYAYLHRSLPQVEGTLRLPGLKAEITVLRDAWRIPHIYAASVDDAMFGLGFVHAQDRLWQMEMNRRIGAGRLAEVLGPGALDTDKFLRTLGVRRAAQASLEALDGKTRDTLDAYAAGVNAFLATNPVLPPEFWLLRVEPQPWMPVDSVAWTKMMAWDLGGNWKNEVLRMRLAKNFSLARINEFLPPYPGEAPPQIQDLKELYRALGVDTVRLAQSAENIATQTSSYLIEAAGSNNWVVSGEHTASGKPLLANDPHLGLTAPPVWYFAHLVAPGLNAIGATLPGVPAIVLGRNQRIAWGFTNTGPDVQDLYIEKLEGDGKYLAPDGPRTFETLRETIRVRGAEDVQLTVRRTRHGPVLSEVSQSAGAVTPRGHVLAFSWTALAKDDRTMQSALKIARAGNWREFLTAAEDLHAPQQNIVYADVDGNIGFVAAGRVPVRKPDNDLRGLAPAPGWLAKYDWDGYLPFGALPRVLNPRKGTIVTANHKIVPPDYPHYITAEWQPPYRAERIEALLEAEPKHSSSSFARMQADSASLAVRELLPHFRATRPRSEAARRALARLSAWDGTMAKNLPEPLIVVAWWRELTRAIYADELGDAFRLNWRPRAQFVANVLADRDGQSRWCDDVNTPARETCAEVLALSLEAALADLRNRFGDDLAQWRWGAAHTARHEHRPLGRQKWLAPLFDIAVPSAGDAYTVNVGRSDFFDDAEPFTNRHSASLRAIYDLSDLDKSLFIHSGGQSGNPLSPHYAAFSEAWAKTEYIPMRTDRAMIEAGEVKKLVLLPR
ncbi:MAG: acyl-homoserine lactone acylase [Betaproteobacteria bacterium SG8_39]|nr:MAG: acyl-homoserine lactone acylase [Betaproteobacteria bacterium SG8_39]